MRRSDTPSEVQKRYDRLWRNLSLEERFLSGLSLIRASREMLIAGLKSRFPNLSEKELRQRLLQQIYKI